MNKNGEQWFRVLRVIATVMANLVAVLSVNFIVFYILDHYNQNQHYIVHSDFFLTKYLIYILPVLMLLTALLYLLLYAAGGLKPRRFQKKRLIWILVIDVLVAGAFAMAVNTYTFDWLDWRKDSSSKPVALATMPPKTTPAPTDTPVPTFTPVPTDEPETQVTNAAETIAPEETPGITPEPTEAPTPEPTPIPGLLGDKYKEKFAEGEPVMTEPNTSETLEDGTVCTLIYTYAGKNAAVELYHFKKGKLEYQIAEIYVRELENLTASYGSARMLYEFAREKNALIAINSDYFDTNAIGEGLLIRNRELIRSNPCRYSDLCVVYQDGTVRCYDCKQDQINNDEILQNYPYHSFYFGPSLLDADGNAKTKFNSTLGASNPRTAFGYYEPGHYAFISVLGDRNMKDINGHGLGAGKSPGMTLTDLSALCASRGMKAAYNFDGGASSGMYWNEKLFGHNNRVTGDILAVVD